MMPEIAEHGKLKLLRIRVAAARPGRRPPLRSRAAH
jgi:hypothetical protein